MKSLSKKLIQLVFISLALIASVQAQSPREQLQQLTAQLQQTPSDNALRERIIKLGAELKPAPAIPEEARRAFVRGNAAMSEAKTPEEYARAVQLYHEALSIAPWWGDPYFNLAKVRELRQEYDAAILGLRFFLLTGIAGNDARQAQDQIYVLEEKRDRRAKADEASAREANSPQAREAALLQKVEGARFVNHSDLIKYGGPNYADIYEVKDGTLYKSLQIYSMGQAISVCVYNRPGLYSLGKASYRSSAFTLTACDGMQERYQIRSDGQALIWVSPRDGKSYEIPRQ